MPDSVSSIRGRLLKGLVIPAHPLALSSDRRLDERHQRALTRYYLAAGAGGLAIGVHTTQFEIHRPEVGLYRPVLELAAEEAKLFAQRTAAAPLLVAGLVGPTDQAVREAQMASALGYECGLVSLGALADASIEALGGHIETVSEVLPVFGFYLQPAVGGRVLEFEFWRRFCEIDRVIAVKIAPFNRYQTLDVVRAVAESGRLAEIALYTGNDDSILIDLLTQFPFGGARIQGGLLGHWAVWTRRAVEILEELRQCEGTDPVSLKWLTLAAEVTDANAAFFDAANRFQGCIAGIHEVLRRQGLLQGRWCLNPREELSSGQMEEIDRVLHAYPHLNDDEFVQAHLDEWLRP